MHNSEFLAQWEKARELLFKTVTEYFEDAIEIDLSDEGLIFVAGEERPLLVTRQCVKREIWLSSPLRGAIHFIFDATIKNWVSKKNASLLLTPCVMADLNILVGKTSE